MNRRGKYGRLCGEVECFAGIVRMVDATWLHCCILCVRVSEPINNPSPSLKPTNNKPCDIHLLYCLVCSGLEMGCRGISVLFWSNRNFRSHVLLLPGAKVPPTEFSLLGTFAPWNFRSLELLLSLFFGYLLMMSL